MFRIALIAAILIVASLSLPGCFDKTFPTQTVYVTDTAQTAPLVTVHISNIFNRSLTFYVDNWQLVYMTSNSTDSLFVPDSSHLFVRFDFNQRDTIATDSMLWDIR